MSDTTAVEHTDCPACGEQTLTIEMVLRARPLGSFSLAGTQTKVSAQMWPRLRCTSCGVSAWGKQ